ncbi:hypothetical protein [Methylocella sp.]|uniref:hypothetical protein n=1 Tax=Methylocella sp. TaxID=1978226 RepID=UPI0037851ECF
MRQGLIQLKARRAHAAETVRHCERDLMDARVSAANGGRSRAILLQLERALQEERKDLARLDAQLADIDAARSS